MSFWNTNSSNSNNYTNYIQFCLNYQTQFNNMLLTQHQMHNNIFNLINTGRANTETGRANTETGRANTETGRANINTGRANINTGRANPTINNRNIRNQNGYNRVNRNIPFERTRIFTFPLTNDIGNFTRTMNDNVRDMINELLTDINVNSNSSILTQEQIDNACEIIKFQDVSSVHDCCPISLVPFQQNDDVMRIKYCNHIFLPENLRRWLSRSSKCPLCRFDIRYYSTNNTSNNDNSMNDTSNNDTISTFTNENTNTIPSLTTTNTTMPNTTTPNTTTPNTTTPNTTTPNNSTYLTTLQLLNGFNDIMRRI